MPYLFNVNIKLIWLDNEFENPKDGILTFEDENEKGIPTITLGFFFSSYFHLYPPNLSPEIEEILIKTNNNKKPEIKQLISPLENVDTCPICKKKTGQLAFLEKKIKICEECLQKYIVKIIGLRAKNFINENCFGKEFYSRPMKLQDDYYLDDYEFIELIEDKNLINALQSKLTDALGSKSGGSCLICKKVDKICQLPCKCNFCTNCLFDIVRKGTKNYVILNSYEKKKLGKIMCKCGSNLDVEAAVQQLSQKGLEIDKRQNSAFQRFASLIRQICFVCETVLFEEMKEGNKNDAGKYKLKQLQPSKKVKVVTPEELKENKIQGIDFLETDHSICIPCSKKLKKIKIGENELKTDADEKEGNNMKSENLEENYTEMFCKICNMKHLVTEIEGKKNDGGCCGEDCIIY